MSSISSASLGDESEILPRDWPNQAFDELGDRLRLQARIYASAKLLMGAPFDRQHVGFAENALKRRVVLGSNETLATQADELAFGKPRRQPRRPGTKAMGACLRSLA